MDDRDEDNHEQSEEHVLPRKRRSRACDQCRRRKVRCDKPEASEEKCSTCIAFDDDCTFSPGKRRNGDEEYIRHLELKVARLQTLVQQLQAQLEEKTKQCPSRYSRELPATDASLNVEDNDDYSIVEGFRLMTLNDLKHCHYMGRSSYIGIINTAISMKRDSVTAGDSGGPTVNADPMMLPRLRPQFWMHLSDIVPPAQPYTDFPALTLMSELLNTYFSVIHTTFPLLHQPTFLQGVVSGLHLVDEGFGAVLLLVCALGARFSTDPTRLPPGVTSWQLEGWRWFDQVRTARKFMSLTKTSLYDLQVVVLAAAYASSLGLPYANYTLVGYGLRLAQNLGLHRRTTYEPSPTLEDELKRRVFWCLIAMDRAMCTVLGRPCNIQDADFDLDFPTECDDEFWITENLGQTFEQPSGRPSTVSHFVWYLKLMRINARALQNIYSLPGSKALQNLEHAQQVVADLDSDLNNWADSLPGFLKYDSCREDLPFAAQAASLQGAYLNLRIFVHRAFITMPCKAPAPFPSFAICTNAARSCIQVLERLSALSGPGALCHFCHFHIGSLLQAGIIMLLHAWRGMRAGMTSDTTQEFELVERALRVLKSLELHWDIAGRFWDILHHLLTAIEGNIDHATAADSRDIAGYPNSFSMTSAPVPASTSSLEAPQSSSVSAAMGDVNASFYGEPAFQPNPWQGTIAGTGAEVLPRYNAIQASDANLNAIFADYLSMLPHDDMFSGAVQQFFATGQPEHVGETSTGPQVDAAQPYGIFDSAWGAPSVGGSR